MYVLATLALSLFGLWISFLVVPIVLRSVVPTVVRSVLGAIESSL